jgi:hypothetical protein
MKKLFFFLFLVYSSTGFSIGFIPKDSIVTNSQALEKKAHENSIKKLLAMPISEIEKLANRKLTFKEKLGVKILKLKYKQALKKPDEEQSKKGKTALTLGIIALASLFIFPLTTVPLGILAITNAKKALKINPNDSDAKAGKIIGIVALCFFGLLLITLFAYLALLVSWA